MITMTYNHRSSLIPYNLLYHGHTMILINLHQWYINVCVFTDAFRANSTWTFRSNRKCLHRFDKFKDNCFHSIHQIIFSIWNIFCKKIVFSEPVQTGYGPSFCFNQLKCTTDNFINIKRIRRKKSAKFIRVNFICVIQYKEAFINSTSVKNKITLALWAHNDLFRHFTVFVHLYRS